MGKRQTNPYQRRRVWPTRRDENAFEPEFSERYIDASARGVIPPRGRPITPFTILDTKQGYPVHEDTGEIMEKVQVGLKPAHPIIRQARFV
ncbi:MAG: hypothetical protein GY916_03020, partial [Gammaproteobacteria bacterium]|nr:hypothetical protein [Gammaproteobacteria bacterium]